MTRFAPFALAALAVSLVAAPVRAQESYYDTEGRVSPPDLFRTDGFRPVWQQQLEEQRAKAAAEAAAKQRAQAGAAAAPSTANTVAKPKQ